MGLLKQYRAKATTFRDGKKAADFESKEQNYTSIITTTTKKQQRGVNEGKNGFTSSPNNKNNNGFDKGGDANTNKKWKSKRAGAKERRIRILRSLPLSRALTEQELAKMFKTVLQPVRAKYGGAGFAKPSVYVDISDEYFSEKFQELFDEHVDGFGGKSLTKMGKKNEEMLWKQRLKEKQGREQFVVVKSHDDDDDEDNSSHSKKRQRRRRMMMSKKGEEENAATRGNEDDKTKPFLSRKQRKLALQRGEVVLESNHSSDDKMNHRKASFASELQKQALLAAAEAGF
ncbi:predicted protein [Bathycoccus prasinos]|uniref:Uncharacterized protein n=1 Tax=Bathycoccus prasinos TaxID=41875 RepID=K8EEW8_9CHLO|nr:predicted protein [Bathycoccus prasinos]CCO16571.1 predicted protein [Bathycoccus prasinos]|eukprot:XP_007513013.1 predicted protein [Bathycoccus prasinos]